jgi:hypothetical protein
MDRRTSPGGEVLFFILRGPQKTRHAARTVWVQATEETEHIDEARSDTGSRRILRPVLIDDPPGLGRFFGVFGGQSGPGSKTPFPCARWCRVRTRPKPEETAT